MPGWIDFEVINIVDDVERVWVIRNDINR